MLYLLAAIPGNHRLSLFHLQMNRTTFHKIALAADRLRTIHANPGTYKMVVPLLDEPYQLTLRVMDYPDSIDEKEVARQIGVNHHTVKQVRKALKH